MMEQSMVERVLSVNLCRFDCSSLAKHIGFYVFDLRALVHTVQTEPNEI